MSRFLNSSLKGLVPYTPGEQPQNKKYVKLNTNESPFPPSEKALDSIGRGELGDLRLYSDPVCRGVRERLARVLGVETENTVVTNGSDEALNFFFASFCENGVVFNDITYGFYKVFADLYSLDYTEIPLLPDFSVDVDKFIGINKNVVIANPNAPTGLALPLSVIEEIVRSNPENIVLVDEAYIDFGGESAVPLTKKYDNLLVVGTFSKSRSLAGARIGYAVGSKELISDMHAIRYSTNPYNVNRLTLKIAEAVLDDNGYYMNNCRRIIENREYATAELRRRGFSVLDSKANFIFAKSEKISGEEYYLRLKEKGVLVRHFTNPRICEYNRITIGTKEDMDVLLSATDEIFKELSI